ncbi:3'-5' exonuclease [Patescibacteria group bacterium]|nr:3'-5' exonuclease [Patescibacteria group bacterium]MCG2694762.1 3'-5' exonuclease [Candidatus Parcubacteria bacterium]
MKLIFLDTETTGNDLKKDRLCQVCYKIEGGNIEVENFKPTVPISIKAMSITNITNKMVENKPAFVGSEMAKKLQNLLDENVLVAHNAKFDIAMLESDGLKVPNYICTLRLARYLDEQQEIPEYNLQFLRYYYDIDFDVEIIPHSADGDVLVLEAVFKHLYDKAKEKSNSANHEEIIQRMIDISKKPSLIKKFQFGKYNGYFVEDVAKEDSNYLKWFLKTKEEEGTDEDWIFTLKHFLKK